MNYRYCLLYFITFFVGCAHSKQTADIDKAVSIYKKWEFKKYDVANFNTHQGLFFGGDKIKTLDLTNKDTLIFIYENKGSTENSIPYKIIDDTLVMENKYGKGAFRIWKLTDNELVLVIPDNVVKKSKYNLTEMIFEAEN